MSSEAHGIGRIALVDGIGRWHCAGGWHRWIVLVVVLWVEGEGDA